MTRDQAIAVLRVLTAAWPNATLTDDTVELWVQFLDGVGYSEARIVASELVLAEQWMPTIARFREAIVARRRREAQRYVVELASGERVLPPDEARERLAALRAALAGGGA